MTGAVNQQERPGFEQWDVGFVDGEGCFSVPVFRQRSARLGWQVQPEFAVVQAAPNATIDQTKLFAEQIYDVYRSFPEASSIFQLTFPTNGFGGMVVKPWSERTKTTADLLMESAVKLSQVPGIRAIPLTPPALPGGGDFPVDFVIASPTEPQQLADFAKQLVQKAMGSGMFIFADADLKFD